MAICLIDTSVLLKVLNVPEKANDHETFSRAVIEKADAGESLLLPLATIIETGNHIAQNGNGNQRRSKAQLFVTQINMALEGLSPYKPLDFIEQDSFMSWINDFPDYAMREVGIGDLSIIKDYENQVELLRKNGSQRRVYIWAIDSHLEVYDTHPNQP